VASSSLTREVKMAAADRLAKSAVDAYGELMVALQDRRRWPREHFARLFSAVSAYVSATGQDDMIHRSVASCVNGLREYLESCGRRVPGDALFDADRLETMLFSGYDPLFEGDEPPDL
jgi:hypothetical protein